MAKVHEWDTSDKHTSMDENKVHNTEIDEMLNSACMDKNQVQDTERDEMFLR